jgi:hypothetical protein
MCTNYVFSWKYTSGELFPVVGVKAFDTKKENILYILHFTFYILHFTFYICISLRREMNTSDKINASTKKHVAMLL